MVEPTRPTPLEPPPDSEHDTADDAYQAILAWSKARGYRVKKRRAYLDKQKNLRRWNIWCDKGPNKYEPSGEIRNTETKKVGY
jgi:hypothetical protein